MNIELFPCSGGMAEGFRRAGIVFDYAFDASPDACDSYEHNLAHRPVQMDVADLLRMARGGWSPGEVGLFVADPPCTPWSRAGKRQGQADERDMLGETVSLIEVLRPRAWVIANVPGLDDADHWQKVVRPVIGGMAQRCGYCVDYASFDAADYGVPQHRIRPFWFGHPIGTPCIRWPAPTHGDWATMRLDRRKPWVTCRDALGHLPPDKIGRPIHLRWRDGLSGKNHRPSEADAPARTLTQNQASDGATIRIGNGKRKWSNPHPCSHADKPAYVITTRQREGGGGGAATVLGWPWSLPSTTITADPNGSIAAPGHNDGSRLSQPNAVVLSETAAGILQGFPENWLFSGRTKAARWSQIGQAMPPPLAEAFASSVARWLRENALAKEAS